MNSSAKFMYENNTMAGYVPQEGIISALKHGTLALGQLGLAETLQILIGCDHTTDAGMELAKKIESLFKERCASYKEQYRLNFGVYYTPAENLCYTAFKKWKEQFGDYAEVTYYTDEKGEKHDKLYFTNSIHVPVYKPMSAFKKIEIEAQLTGYSSAGCITYVEVKHDVIHNIESLEEMLDFSMEHDIPYLAFNRESDQCMSCGYQGHIDEVCPRCEGTNIEHLARVTGYLTGDYKSAFNEGEISEKEAEKVSENEYDMITFRAFRPLDKKMIKTLLRIVKKGGFLCAYKAKIENITQEMNEIADIVPEYQIEKLKVPYLEDSQRNLVIIKK